MSAAGGRPAPSLPPPLRAPRHLDTMTVRLKVGSTSWITWSHSELAHSTDDCCRNRISLLGKGVVGERCAAPRGLCCAPWMQRMQAQLYWKQACSGSGLRPLPRPLSPPPHLCDGAACWRTMRMMSSGVESASPLRAFRMKPGVSMIVRLAQYAYLDWETRRGSWLSQLQAGVVGGGRGRAAAA